MNYEDYLDKRFEEILKKSGNSRLGEAGQDGADNEEVEERE